MKCCTWEFLYKNHTQTTILKHFHLCLQDTPSQQPELMPKETPGLSRAAVPFQLSATKKDPDFCLGQAVPCNTIFICSRRQNQITQKEELDGSRVTLYFQHGAYTAFLTLVLFGKISVTGLGFKKVNWKDMDRNHTIYLQWAE